MAASSVTFNVVRNRSKNQSSAGHCFFCVYFFADSSQLAVHLYLSYSLVFGVYLCGEDQKKKLFHMHTVVH